MPILKVLLSAPWLQNNIYFPDFGRRNMKKIILISCLVLGQASHAFSGSLASFNSYIEDWLSVSLLYGVTLPSFSDPGNTMDKSFGGLGTAGNFYSFSNGHSVGFYFHLFFLAPGASVAERVESGNTIKEEMKVQFGLIIGPGFRVRLGYDMFLHLAAGLQLDLFSGTYKQIVLGSEIPYNLNGMNVGAGADLGFKKNLNDSFFIDFGCTVGAAFMNKVFLEVPGGGTVPKYSWILVKPYISVGINMIVEKSVYIKIGEEGYYY